MYEEEWNCGQKEQGPLWKPATSDGDLAAVTNRTFHVSLSDDVYTTLRVGTHCDSCQQRVSGIASGRVCRGCIRKFGNITGG
jgi:hypothetical protein